jgi:hypothetical protein
VRTPTVVRRRPDGSWIWLYVVLAATGLLDRLTGPLRDGGPLRAGGGGSSLPWWSPIAVTLLLFGVAVAYRRWDRARERRGGNLEPPAGEHPASGGDVPLGEERLDSGDPPNGPRGPLVSRETPRFPGTVDGRAPSFPG